MALLGQRPSVLRGSGQKRPSESRGRGEVMDVIVVEENEPQETRKGNEGAPTSIPSPSEFPLRPQPKTRAGQQGKTLPPKRTPSTDVEEIIDSDDELPSRKVLRENPPAKGSPLPAEADAIWVEPVEPSSHVKAKSSITQTLPRRISSDYAPRPKQGSQVQTSSSRPSGDAAQIPLTLTRQSSNSSPEAAKPLVIDVPVKRPLKLPGQSNLSESRPKPPINDAPAKRLKLPGRSNSGEATPKPVIAAPPKRTLKLPGQSNSQKEMPKQPVPKEASKSQGQSNSSEAVPKQPPATPTTPSTGPSNVATLPASRWADESIRNERPEWAARCPVERGTHGKPPVLSVSMAEAGMKDSDLEEWCQWMDRRLAAARAPSTPAPIFQASCVDFSENSLSAQGMKVLCNLLEKHGVKCEVLRLSGNHFGNDGMRCIAKYLTSSCQAPVLELLLTKNRFNVEGVSWLLGNLAMHPAYPVWDQMSFRYVPIWLRVENSKVKEEAPHLSAICESLSVSVCLGERIDNSSCGPKRCVNVGCSEDLKHNCVAHIAGTTWKACGSWPAPAVQAKSFFEAPGKSAPRAPPTGAEEPRREEPRIVYQDVDLAVVFKPSGWSSDAHPEGVDPSWAQLGPLHRRRQVARLMLQANPAPLQGWILLQFGHDPASEACRDQAVDRGMVHRLDTNTSGPLLISKTMKGFEHARKQILLGLLKDYVVLVHGCLPAQRGECQASIDVSGYEENQRVRTDPSGQPSTTLWEVLVEYESAEGEKYSLVHCRMVTLRTHQLRVHMQHLGHPVVGDTLYGGSSPAFCPRLFLHKVRIGFFNIQGQACIERCSLQASPELWKALGRLKKVGGAMGCGAPGR